MMVMFYNRKQDYNTWTENVAKLINGEKAWIATLKFPAGNEIEVQFPKRTYQLMEIRN